MYPEKDTDLQYRKWWMYVTMVVLEQVYFLFRQKVHFVA